jgi:hypothetical protein
MAATIEIGRMILAGQLLQNAARVGARELAMIPLPPTWTFEQALADPEEDDVRKFVYHPGKLCLKVDGLGENQVQAIVDGWPIVNRMLAPLMLRETVEVGGSTVELLRYPGALVENAGGGQLYPYTVVIPRVLERASDGTETIDFVPVVEEVVPRDSNGDPIPAHAPFSLASAPDKRERGLVALRINYPFQAAMFSAFMEPPVDPSDPDAPHIGIPVLANDAEVVVQPSGGTQPPSTVEVEGSLYSGQYGLGGHHALALVGEQVRPFRRLLSAQSLFRREVFAPTPP